MLSVFPQLLTFSLFAPFILRLAVGIVFIALGVRHVGKSATGVREELARIFPWAGSFAILFGLIEFALGTLLVIGLWTQVAAILAGIGALKFAYFKHRFSFAIITPFSVSTYVLLAVISLSLLFTGAGLLAFDLPL